MGQSSKEVLIVKRSSGPRKTANLSESCNQQLNDYARAATAAGLGLLALVLPAEGKIVYTPANLPLISNHHQVFIDLNHDGVDDFFFSATDTGTARISSFLVQLRVLPAQQGNAIWRIPERRHNDCAAALPAGIQVRLKRPFRINPKILFHYRERGASVTSYCAWKQLRTAYLGLKFNIKGKTHFGWARVKVFDFFIVTLTGYAYETIPNKAIITGKTEGPDVITLEPASLGALAAGASRLHKRK
jgi:hypothetical protein